MINFAKVQDLNIIHRSYYIHIRCILGPSIHHHWIVIDKANSVEKKFSWWLDLSRDTTFLGLNIRRPMSRIYKLIYTINQYHGINKFKQFIRIDLELIWLWVAIDLEIKEIIGFSISKERNTFGAEHFLSNHLK